MVKKFARVIVFIAIFTIVLGGIGVVNFKKSYAEFWVPPRQVMGSLVQVLKKHDPDKPTVAVVLSNQTTEGLDFAIPYQVFSMTGAFNVYAVANDNQARALTGGVDVIPHYSFEQLDTLLGGKSADIIAIPALGKTNNFESIREWIIKHKDTTLLSICAGANSLAATGLLDGKTAATHWQTVVSYKKKYPKVNWVEDQRFVSNDGGRIVSSAGISSGIDATLFVISQRLGDTVAKRIAEQLRYPTFHYVSNPKVEPYKIELNYSTYLLNNAFRWRKKNIGVLLYNGVEEMAVTSVFDVFSNTGTTRILSITDGERPVTTKHGLTLLPRHSMTSAPPIRKMIVPGAQAETLAAKEVERWMEAGNAKDVQFVHSGYPERFIFERQLEDLALQEDVLTAKHAIKRLEFRGSNLSLSGPQIPTETYVTLLLCAILSAGLAWLFDRYVMNKRRQAV
ncbi:DJ-1/PfpI family protein [Paenibacillus sp. TRM 82003]|nr:DJ-1/PfpI family protein [Paenibacillus sp. TRM 82003]